MKYPRPSWEPVLVESPDKIAERLCDYTDRQRAFVVFKYGTAVFSDGVVQRSDADYRTTLLAAVQQTADFKVVPMKDGNLLVRFAGPVTGLVFIEFLTSHDAEIRAGVDLGGLLPGERVFAPDQNLSLIQHFYAGVYARAKLYRDVAEMTISKAFSPTST
jgi:hypothetical protein